MWMTLARLHIDDHMLCRDFFGFQLWELGFVVRQVKSDEISESTLRALRYL